MSTTAMRTGRPEPRFRRYTAVDLELLRDQRLAALDHAELRGRAAHVERDQVAHVAGRPERGRGERATRRPGLEQAHRKARRSRGRGDAAVREHDVQRPAEAEPLEPQLEIGEVLLDEPLDVDVRDRRRGALELADLGHDLAGDRDAQARRDRAHRGGRALLVERVREAVQERDGEGLDARRRQARVRAARRERGRPPRRSCRPRASARGRRTAGGAARAAAGGRCRGRRSRSAARVRSRSRRDGRRSRAAPSASPCAR